MGFRATSLRSSWLRGATGSRLTYGLEMIGVGESQRGGQGEGIAVAVLDTGIDLDHPEFTREHIVARNFVDGGPPKDGHGHGTHVCGIVASVANAAPRYGVAPGVFLYVAKVLDDGGSGSDPDPDLE